MNIHHRHDSETPGQPRAWRPALAVIIPAAVVTIAALIWLWPPDRQAVAQPEGAQRVLGTITAIARQPCPEPPPGTPQPPGAGPGANGCGTATIQLSDSAEAGRSVTAELPGGPGAPVVAVDDDVVLLHLADASYQIIDHERGDRLWILAAAFVLAVVAFGRWRGLTALAGLGVTFAVLLVFVVPAILAGRSPLLVAIAGSAAIMLTVLYLTHGFTMSTSVAVVGTLASLTLTGALSAIAVAATHLTGVADDQTSYLVLTQNLNMEGLLLAGILIGSLGVLDDVTVTQAATVDELARANPAYGFAKLYGAAVRVGRAHIASVINTIILAYAGASLPLLVLIAAGSQPLGELLTNQLIAQELVRSAVGTLGLIAAVPITTALAALTVRRTSGGDGPTRAVRTRRARTADRPADRGVRLAVLSREADDAADGW